MSGDVPRFECDWCLDIIGMNSGHGLYVKELGEEEREAMTGYQFSIDTPAEHLLKVALVHGEVTLHKRCAKKTYLLEEPR